MAKRLTDIRSYARSFDRAAITTLAGIMRSKKAPPAARVAAANSILDRGHGKPEQSTELNAEIQITIRNILNEDAQPKIVEGVAQRLLSSADGTSGDAAGTNGDTEKPNRKKRR